MTFFPSSEALTIKRIVRVNHAGEYGAIRIYSAQIFIARRLCPDVLPALEQMLADEILHCEKFRAAMLSRTTRPCWVLWFWGLGGSLLGAVTALMGRNTIWMCTAAVEEAVHRHLEDQMNFLQARDAGLYEIIESIRSEELAHLNHAEDKLRSTSSSSPLLRSAIARITDMLIWLSTYGASTRMSRALATKS